MIIPVWESTPQPEENFDVQQSVVPKMQYRRLLIKAPSLQDLEKIALNLRRAGVPENAALEFSQWNAPSTNWYVHASWVEE